MLERSIQLLACEFHVSTDDEPVMRWLDEVRPSAVQNHPVSERHRLEIHREAGGYRVREDGQDRGLLAGSDEAGTLVERRLHELAFGALAACTKVHAGCATWRGRRVLVVGQGRAGKTTLMTRLLVEGFAVEGDEMVVVRDGQVVAYPRRFGIRRRTLDLVPEVGALAPHLAGQATQDEPDGYQILALDPCQLGRPWRIAAGPVDVLWLLEDRHAGPTLARACATDVMVRGVLAQSEPPSTGRAAWVRDVCSIVRRAAGYRITLGDLDSAVATVRECISPWADTPITNRIEGPSGTERARTGRQGGRGAAPGGPGQARVSQGAGGRRGLRGADGRFVPDGGSVGV